MRTRRVSVVLFEGFDLLDVFGPVKLLSMLPERFTVTLLGPAAGAVTSSQGTRVIADDGYVQAGAADIVLMPGGTGTRALVQDAAFLEMAGCLRSSGRRCRVGAAGAMCRGR